MSTKPGRNDPCPCGSGKKYKHCCGAPSVHPETPARRAGLPEDAVGRVLRFVARPDWDRAREAARAQFLAPVLALDDEARATLWAAHPGLEGLVEMHFYEWLIADYVDPTGRNPIDEYLRRRGWQETAAGQTWLTGLRQHRLSVYEVQAVTPGEGLVLKDQLRDLPPCQVSERSASQALQRWDHLVTRIIPFSGQHLLSGAGLHLPRALAEALIQALRTEGAAATAQPAPDEASWLATAGPRLMAAYLNASLYPPPPPELVTADGEPLVFAACPFTYPAEQHAALIAALEAHPDLHRAEAQHFVWLGPLDKTGEQRRVLGDIELHRRRGVLETRSKAQLERGKALLETLFPAGSVTFQPAVFEDPWQAARQPSLPPEEKAADVLSEPRQEMLHAVLDRHYRAWCDQSLPALAGQTPRQAVQTPAGRAAVMALLKDFENQEARRAAAARYDFRWLWKALGLAYPDEQGPLKAD